MKKLLSLVLAVAMLLSVAAVAFAEDTLSLPRNETLYFGGQQWDPVVSWNPLATNQNNAMAISPAPRGSRTVMFETLYMYNMLDGQLYPLLADGAYTWNDDLTVMTVKINADAKWNDGTPVTADDVVATWEASLKLQNGTAVGYEPYIASIENVDGAVVITTTKTEAGQPTNPLQVLNFLSGVYVCQKAWIDDLFARNNNDVDAIMADKVADHNVAFSGPYGFYYESPQIVVYVRNDAYWGQAASMWGKLPAPKYIAHTIYADNAATQAAFMSGAIDVDQQFLANVQDLWLEQNLPISTFMDEAPYGVCATMPTAWYNMDTPVLQVPEVRKAIAMAVNYDEIIANAMTNQSPSFADVPRSLFNPTEGEQALYDHEAVKDLQWVGNDVEGAKALLDSVGIVDTDGDGYREYNGEKVSLQACCPQGWSDWEASMQIVSNAGQAIGLDITTNFPDWGIYQTVFTKAQQNDYDIFMWSPAGAEPAAPWSRIRALMSSEYIGVEGNWSGNWGHYKNDRIDEIIAAIPLTTDEAELKALYTEATKIYLTDVPSFSLMYRPEVFHAVYEGVWTGYPEAGGNIPPMDCTDGYGIAALYNLELVD
jgi:peptide/nickel transport system substrate-binding protein